MENQYKVDVLNNPRMVQNIRYDGGFYTEIYCNSGERRVTKEYTIEGYSIAWFDEGDITNTLSFNMVR